MSSYGFRIFKRQPMAPLAGKAEFVTEGLTPKYDLAEQVTGFASEADAETAMEQAVGLSGVQRCDLIHDVFRSAS